MTGINSQLKTLVSASVALFLLQSCSGDGSTSSGGPALGVNGSYLHISTPDFYFGTNNVGTKATQYIQITNRGADAYPLKSIAIKNHEGEADNSEEFSTDVIEDIVLNPSEFIKVGISFQPITDGRKFADFVVEYDTIIQAEEADNINEQNYYEGKAKEDAGEYAQAKALYNDYINSDPVTVNKRRAAIKLPVIQESQVYGDGQDFDLYLSALDLRETGDYSEALIELATVQTLYTDGYLADDALYLQGYIELMDQKNYEAALRTMQLLRNQYPDSTYYDTALYSEAMAQQAIGNSLVAREILLDLAYRHTAIDTLGITLPKDNMVSRLWFERANTALENLST